MCYAVNLAWIGLIWNQQAYERPQIGGSAWRIYGDGKANSCVYQPDRGSKATCAVPFLKCQYYSLVYLIQVRGNIREFALL